MSEKSLQPQDKYVLRLPDGMRNRLKAAAVENNRSLNAEMIARLEGSFHSPNLPSDLRIRLLTAADDNHRSFDTEAIERLEQSFEIWPNVSLPTHMVARGMNASSLLRSEYERELDEFANHLFTQKFPEPDDIASLISKLFAQAIRDSGIKNEHAALQEYFSFAVPFLRKLGYEQDTTTAFMQGRYAGFWPEEGHRNPFPKADEQHAAWEAGFEEGKNELLGMKKEGG